MIERRTFIRHLVDDAKGALAAGDRVKLCFAGREARFSVTAIERVGSSGTSKSQIYRATMEGGGTIEFYVADLQLVIVTED